MKTIYQVCLLGIALFLHVPSFAQKDSIRLLCPLQNATLVKKAKQPMLFDVPEMSVLLTSATDSVVMACAGVQVTNTETDEDGKLGVVLFCRFRDKDYYFWYTGLSKLTVKRLEVLKAGQPLGLIKPGDKLELLMYDFETPVDPLRYLQCAGVKQEPAGAKEPSASGNHP